MAERTEIEAAEGLHPIGRGLDHVAGGMDLIVEDDQHPLAARLRRPGDLQRVDQIGPGIGAERARRPLRPDQHHRVRRGEGEVQKERGLLEGRGAVRDDKAGDFRVVARDPVDHPAQLDPVVGADRGAADLAVGDRHRIGDQPGFGKLVEQRLAGQLLPEIGVVEDVERAGAERGNRAAGADDRDAGKVGHLLPPLSFRDARKGRPGTYEHGILKAWQDWCQSGQSVVFMGSRFRGNDSRCGYASQRLRRL